MKNANKSEIFWGVIIFGGTTFVGLTKLLGHKMLVQKLLWSQNVWVNKFGGAETERSAGAVGK